MPTREAPLVCTPVEGPPYTLPTRTWTVADQSLVDRTQADTPVGQTLLTDGDTQYVAYYDADRQMTVATRRLGSDRWIRQPLPEHVGGDNHNSVTIALDREGQLHVSGNMHNDPLCYFRTRTAGDVTTLERVTSMGRPELEGSVTYPVFLHNASGELVFTFRDGVSGNGSTYCNVYDEGTRTWRRLFSEPLFDGQGRGNSYPSDPEPGPDGRFHMVWVWRTTGDAATNSTLSYARSHDLAHWETIRGEALSLPLSRSTPGVVVDPVPDFGGLLNGIPKIGFDARRRVLVSYTKFDAAGNTQAYVARPGSGADAWEIVQVSRWTGRYPSRGVGYIPPPPLMSAVTPLPDGSLQLSYTYQSDGGSYAGTWVLDADTLQPFTEVPIAEILRFDEPPLPDLPSSVTAVRSPFPGMLVRLRAGGGSPGPAGERWFLRHESLHQPPAEPPFPDPSPLEVVLARPS